MSTLNITDIQMRLKTARGTPAYDSLIGFISQNSDLDSFEGQPTRVVYRYVWPFFVILCTSIIFCGAYINVRYFLWIMSRSKVQKPSHVYQIRAFAYLINGIICDLLKVSYVPRQNFATCSKSLTRSLHSRNNINCIGASQLLVVFPLSVGNLLLRFYRLGETTVSSCPPGSFTSMRAI